MAHKEQVDFCKEIKSMHPSYFKDRLVLDIGSLDINGNNQYLFENCGYIGIDLLPGKNVDFASKGHELRFPNESFDVVISTECFEHDSFYSETIRNIIRMLKPGGLFLFSCATTGRPEHGTQRTTPEDAPFVQKFGHWADYYKNLEEKDIRLVVDIDNIFEEYSFSINEITHDLYFWGIKKGVLCHRTDYSFLLEDSEKNSLSTQLRYLLYKFNATEEELQKLRKNILHFRKECKTLERSNNELLSELQLIIASRSWRLTKPLRLFARLLRGEISIHLDSDKTSLLKEIISINKLRNGFKYIIRGDISGFLLRLRNLYLDYTRNNVVNKIHNAGKYNWAIITTSHTLFIAHCIAERLKSHGWNVDILTETPRKFSHDWYFVLCAQMFKHLPPGEKRILFQLEQSISSRWFTHNYLHILENSLAITDYSLKNIEYLSEKKISYPHIHYLPIGASHTYDSHINENKSIDVLFYGDSNSSQRRKRMLDVLKENFDVKIVNEVFGQEMISLIKRAKVVINIHYYENALLETPRIQECLSLGVHVVSESSGDMNDYPELAGAVTFFEKGSIQSMLNAVNRALHSDNSLTIRQSVEKSILRFDFMLDRFLVAMGFLPIGHVANMIPALSPESDIVCLSLPETIQRRNIYKAVKPPFCEIFDGVRRTPGWIGCGLSYIALAHHGIRNQLQTLTVMEDDVVLPNDFETALRTIKEYLAKRSDTWDVFAGMIASLNSETKVISIEEYNNFRFVTIDRMTSMVMNIYSLKFMNQLVEWNPENTDAETNTIDRFIESIPNLRVVVTLPFLFGHREDVSSTLWGFNNARYREMIQESEQLLQQKVNEYLSNAQKVMLSATVS